MVLGESASHPRSIMWITDPRIVIGRSCSSVAPPSSLLADPVPIAFRRWLFLAMPSSIPRRLNHDTHCIIAIWMRGQTAKDTQTRELSYTGFTVPSEKNRDLVRNRPVHSPRILFQRTEGFQALSTTFLPPLFSFLRRFGNTPNFGRSPNRISAKNMMIWKGVMKLINFIRNELD